MKTTALFVMLLLAAAPSSFAFIVSAPPAFQSDNARIAAVPPQNRGAAAAGVILPIRKILLDDTALLPAGAGEAADPGAEAKASEWMKSSSISFTPNLGQLADSEGRTRPDLLYTADVSGVRLYFKADGVSYVFTKSEESEEKSVSEATGSEIPSDNAFGSSLRSTESMKSTTTYRMDMTFEGCNPNTTLHGEDALPSYTNYYLAHCPDGITNVKSYAKLVYENIYDNIDLAYYSVLGRMKYEFIVRPGGDPGDIRLRYSGDTDMRISNDGGLEIETPLGSILEQVPVTYQEQRSIQSRFLLEGDELRFEVGEYDAEKVLVIDPWGTYMGGSAEDGVAGVSCDASGNVLITGWTKSTNFPVSNNYQIANAGDYDMIVVKCNSSGVMFWATYYGGSSVEDGGPAVVHGIASDNSGNVITATSTNSVNFPISPGAYQFNNGGGQDVGIVKFDQNGSRIWATYYGGSLADYPTKMCLDANWNILIVGRTWSTNFPVYNAFQPSMTGIYGDAFVIKLSPAGLPLWATYYGGSNGDMFDDVATDNNGNIILGGWTCSTDFPVSAGAFQIIYLGIRDGTIVKFTGAGTRLWATYIGGNEYDSVYGCCCDPNDNIIIVVRAVSTNFPLLNAAFNMGGAAVAKFSPACGLLWSTYFNSITPYDVTTDSNGTVYFCGDTGNGLPVLNAANPVQTSALGNFVASFGTSGQLLWATYWCGGYGLALGQNGNLFTGGSTASTTAPIMNAQQPNYGGGVGDGFIACLTTGGFYPAELSSLTATVAGPDIRVEWRTEQETGNTGFIIERSADRVAAVWEQLGFVPPVSGTGPHDYSFIDQPPADWTQGQPLYYRLRQLDVDGRETISPAVAVLNRTAASDLEIGAPYPLPASDRTWIDLKLGESQPVSIRLYDALGRLVRGIRDEMELAAGSHVVAIPLVGLPLGVYYMKLDCGNSVETRRIVVQR
jgi:hypothetical protein